MAKLKRNLYKFASLATAMVLILTSAFALAGCSLFDMLFDDGDEVAFTRGSLTMQVGETFDLASIIEADNDSYRLGSSNADVASVRGSVLTAVDVGVARITIKSGSYSDELKVTVKEPVPDTLEVKADGQLIQKMGALSEITFIPTATGGIENSNVVWTVNGKLEKVSASGEPFSYMPAAAGEYVIAARCSNVEAKHTVRVYYNVDASVEIVRGDITQISQPFSAVDFEVTVEENAANPPAFIQLFVDGEVVYEGNDTIVSIDPVAGYHYVDIYVNGTREYRDRAYFRGAIIPEAPTVEFDNVYPHVYVRYEVAGDAQIEITSPQGTVSTIAQTDPQYADMFVDGAFDAGEFITLTADGSWRRSYRIKVKSLGDGDAFIESEYSPIYTFTQLPNEARQYLDTQCLDGDLYVTSAEEYTALLEYYVNFRKKTGITSNVSFKCYIAYSLDGEAKDLWNDAFTIAATSGMYSNIRVDKIGNIMNTSFSVSTINTPTRQSVQSAVSGSYSAQLHAILPHINYDVNLYRTNDHVFPIDRIERTREVVYSDELYLTAQRGVRPVPKVGSSAEILYEKARDVLRKICTDNMTDVQKAHAIYDWIMWQVTYDTPATNIPVGGENYSAYYLEGVFGDGNTSIGGVKYSPYAVCDGMSKAYALMCNIEGIPCVRVVGKAGLSVADSGGHAWNKVYVDGAWYVVDCTWGDSQGELTLDGRKRVYELGIHDYLFVTDRDISSTHFEPYRTGDSTIKYSPKTADKRLNVYKDAVYNGSPLNCYVGSGENVLARLREISAAFARTLNNIGSVTVPGGPNNGVYSIAYQGVEIYVEDEMSLLGNDVNSAVREAVRKTLPNAVVHISTFGNVLIVLISL